MRARSLYSDEITQWLRLVLGKGTQSVTSHSIKTTCLTWASQAGIAVHERRLLAHHVPPGSRSTETYSRDVLAPAARSLAKVLHDIREGRFAPDAPRTAMFPAVRAVSPEAVSPPDTAVPDDALSEGPSSGSEDNEDEPIPLEDSVLKVAPEYVRGPLLDAPSWANRMQHRQSGVIHLSAFFDSDRLLCGRARSDEKYQQLLGDVPDARAKCRQCFSHSSLRPSGAV